MLEKNNMYDQENEMFKVDLSLDTYSRAMFALSLGFIAVGVAGMIKNSDSVQKWRESFKAGRKADTEKGKLRWPKKRRELIVLEVGEDESDSTEEKDKN